MLRRVFGIAAAVTTKTVIDLAAADDGLKALFAGIEAEIAFEYGRRAFGLRHLPRRERSAALRALRDWRRQAQKALRDRRSAERHASHLRRKATTPAPA